MRKNLNDWIDPCTDSKNDNFANLFNATWHEDYDPNKVAHVPVVNLWATAGAVYIALTIWMNVFPTMTPDWMFGFFF